MRTYLLSTLVLTILGAGALVGQDSPAAWAKKLTSKESADRLRAANELGKLGVDAARYVKALGRRLDDEVAEVRNAAADALGKIGKPSVAVIRKALADRDTHLAGLRAATGLGPLAVDLLPAVTACLRRETLESGDAVTKCLLAIGEPALPHLIECLDDKAINVGICRALRSMGPKARPAVPALIELVGRRDLGGPQAAAEALGTIGDAQAVPALLAAAEPGMARLDTTATAVTSACVDALARLGSDPDAVVPFLLRVLASERRDFQFEHIQGRALSALADFDVRSPEVLAGLRAFLAAEPGKNGAEARRLLEKLTR